MKQPSIRTGLGALLFALCLAVGLVATNAASPSLQPLLQGKWPTKPQGKPWHVVVMGNYVYVAGLYAGLQVIDVTNPTNCTLVGGYTGSGAAVRVAISGITLT
jgi:hypothetical protein